MIRQYTSMPLDEPNPGLGGAKRLWTPLLKVRVSINHQSSPTLEAYVDSGAPFCLFNSAVADFLHVDFKKGGKSSLGGVVHGPREPVYFHRVKLTIENNWIIDVIAGFSKQLSVAAILGRTGFFDKFYVRFDHSKVPPELEIEKIELVN